MQNLPELLTLSERFGRAEGLNADLEPAPMAIKLRGFDYEVRTDYVEAINPPQ
jgi:hypothetical protein